MATLPTGVEIHNGKIRIWFIYRGKRCREVMKGWQVNNSNLKKAGNLRSLVVGEIQLGAFDYAKRFPESRAAEVVNSGRGIATFSDLSDKFQENKKLELTNASYLNLVSILNTLKFIVGENTPLSSIQHSDILDYRRELLYGTIQHKSAPWLNREGRAVNTVNTRISTLCSMLKFAYQSQFISHTPFENIKPLKKDKNIPDPLLREEFSALMAALPEFHARIWRVAVFTGMRHGEMCALAWEDVDFDAGTVAVKRNIGNKGLFGPPKTSAGNRTITLLKPALDALREQFELTGEMDPTPITFHHREIGKTEVQSLRFVFRPKAQSKSKAGYYSRGSISYSWRRGVKLAGIRERDPYQSRHTFACWSLSAGANPSFIASQMGHENAKMVYTVYSKWIGDMDKDQVGILNRKFAGMSP